MSVIKQELRDELYTDEFLSKTSSMNSVDFLEKWYSKSNGTGVVDATMMTDQQTYLPDDLLVKVDIASMAVSLEARSPLLDHHVIEFAASLPENLKLRGTTPKYLLKKIAAKLVPPKAVYRRKMGFGVPVGNWFRADLAPFLRETLLNEKCLRRGLFRPEALARMIDQHIGGERDFTYQLWTLLMLELWFIEFID